MKKMPHKVMSLSNVPNRVPKRAFSLVALSQFWSNKTLPERQNETSVTGVTQVLLSLVPQRRRITHTLRAEVVAHYAAGMSCRRVAAALGLGRTTVLQILKAAGIEVRPQGRKY